MWFILSDRELHWHFDVSSAIECIENIESIESIE